MESELETSGKLSGMRRRKLVTAFAIDWLESFKPSGGRSLESLHSRLGAQGRAGGWEQRTFSWEASKGKQLLQQHFPPARQFAYFTLSVRMIAERMELDLSGCLLLQSVVLTQMMSRDTEMDGGMESKFITAMTIV